MNTYRNCQSCGMPLARDEHGGGTESNGRKSPKYCSHCYQNGEFTLPDITVEQMRERVIAKLREFRFPGFVARFMTRKLHMLERWTRSS